MRDYMAEKQKRVDFIREVLSRSGMRGIIFGNSGGKDSALVGILCKLACENTLGLAMPCGSRRNPDEDMMDAADVAGQYGIEARTVDLTKTAEEIRSALEEAGELTDAAAVNIAPRLRMTTLYALAASEGRLVAGTGNRSEKYVGYFTKWGDGAYDFDPIADLTVTEIYEFLEFLGAPARIMGKAPSAGLFEGQTDEGEMGVTYKSIDGYLLRGTCDPEDMMIIDRLHAASEHKRKSPPVYNEKQE